MTYCEWRPIAGYDGKYEASFYGLIRRVYQSKPPRLLTGYDKKTTHGSNYVAVKLSNETGSKEFKVSKIIYETFGGPVPSGYSLAHKDGYHKDNSFNNLVLLSKEELGKKTGHMARRKAVVKCTPDLVPIDVYRSAREAARCNFMSYQTVIDRCNGKVKSLCAPDGYVYLWDEDEDGRNSKTA